MSVLAALLAEADDRDLAALAERLRPLLSVEASAAPDPWLRGAAEIGRYIGAPRSRVYALVEAGRLPIERDGSSLCAKRSDLDEWVRAGGALRP